MRKTEYTLDLQTERLWKGDEPLPISNKAFELLKLFAESPQQLLAKDEILDRIWGEISVTEALVREYVHDLRAALNDDPKAPRYIETVPRRGYRFLGGMAIRERNEEKPSVGRTAGRPVLLVTQFEDLSGTERSARLVSGLTDDLVTDLARFPDLSVAKGSSGAVRADNTETARADYCLEGSVQISDGMVRLNVRLHGLDDNSHIWSEQYDHPLEDLFKVQSELTAKICSVVGGTYGPLAHSERQRLKLLPPSNLEAYELYRLAFDLELTFDRDLVFQALGLIERAVELEPDFARGWLVHGWIAWQLAMEKWVADPTAWRERMRESYRKAAAIDPRDPILVMELSAARAIEGDAIGARDALERSIDLGGHHADTLISCSNYMASILDDSGRALKMLDEGLAMLREVSAFHHFTISRVAFFCGDYERAAQSCALTMDFLPTRLFHALSLSELGRDLQARQARKRLFERAPNFSSADYLLDHPITGERARERFLAACERLDLP